MRNKHIFITGGAGYLGRNIIKRYYADNTITVYSRDEAKHYYLKKEFPNVRCVVGDIRNFDLMKRASKGCDVGIFAASLKQIGAVDQNVEESARVIVDGALNSRRVAEENNFKAACFISSDKSRAATTLYGAMKFVAGESFIVNAEQSNVRLSSAIYGNVLNSTGSIIPLMWDSISKGYPLTLYSPHMTRFMIDIEQAIDLIEHALMLNGFNVIPDLHAFRVQDLFEIYKEKFGLQYDIGTPRISEKLHEMMFSVEEAPRVSKSATPAGDYYIMHYQKIFNDDLPFVEFTSDKVILPKHKLDKLLEKHNYFKP
jgi:UDP-glucose 4-epimerase